MEEDFNNRYYLITGGSSGIGLATATALAQIGYKLVLVSENQEALEKSCGQLPGVGHLYYCYDLDNIKDIENIFLFCHEQQISFSGFIHCAGISPLCLVKDHSPKLIEQVFRINFFSFLEIAKFFLNESYAEEGSKIVAVTSVTAKGAGYRQTLYGASKAAMLSAVKLMAKELLNRNIHINAVSPGVCDTPMLDVLKSKSDNLAESIYKSQPMGAIPPNYIAEVILFLLSDGAKYLTGTEIQYDGGFMLK